MQNKAKAHSVAHIRYPSSHARNLHEANKCLWHASNDFALPTVCLISRFFLWRCRRLMGHPVADRQTLCENEVDPLVNHRSNVADGGRKICQHKEKSLDVEAPFRSACPCQYFLFGSWMGRTLFHRNVQYQNTVEFKKNRNFSLWTCHFSSMRPWTCVASSWPPSRPNCTRLGLPTSELT